MEHIGVGKDELPTIAQCFPRVGRCVTVVHAGIDIRSGNLREEAIRPAELILRECFRWEEIERRRVPVVEESLGNRDVVTERLSACCTGDDDKIATVTGEVDRAGLVDVQPLDIEPPQCFGDRLRKRSGWFRETRRTRWYFLQVDDLVPPTAGVCDL